MTDEGASAGDRQSAGAGPALPGPAGDREADGAASTPSDPADASPQPDPGEDRPRGFVPPDEAGPLELVPAFETSHHRLIGYLADVADDLAQAQAQAAQLASIASEVSSAGSAFRAAGLEAARRLAVPPDLGFALRI